MADELAQPPPVKRPKVEPPSTNPCARLCDYYVLRKRRFCRTQRRVGSRFCPTHDIDAGRHSSSPATATKESGAEIRIPCPINPNHTVYATRLAQHVKVCPDNRFITSNLPYFAEDRHADRGRSLLDGAATDEISRVTNKDLDAEAHEILMHKLTECYCTCVQPHMTVLDVRENLGAVFSQGERRGAEKSLKHTPQHRALLQCMDNVLKPTADSETTPQVSGFLELGAGKGGLAVALQEVLVSYQDANVEERAAMAAALPFLRRVTSEPIIGVVDLGGFRRKGDSRVSRSRIPLRRLRINLKDLDLTKAFGTTLGCCGEGASATTATMRTTNHQHQQWAVIGKHLCGACADFALSCITEHTLAATSNIVICAVVLATCCHHRCELRHMNALQNSSAPGLTVGDGTAEGAAFTFTPREFAAMTSMSSWAVSGAAVSPERQKIGYYCKRILDWVRVLYLRAQGYTAQLCQYTKRDVTEENVCIAAFKVVT